MEEKERKKSRISESVEEEALVEQENEATPSVSVQPTPNYAADLLEATLPALTTSDEVAKVNVNISTTTPSLKPAGITVTPHFTPLPISQVPSAF